MTLVWCCRARGSLPVPEHLSAHVQATPLPYQQQGLQPASGYWPPVQSGSYVSAQAKSGSDGFTTTSGNVRSSACDTLGATLPAGEHSGTGSQSVHKCQGVEDALDELRSLSLPFFDKYVVLGPVERRSGGQGVVQFMRGVHDANGYAAKVRPCLLPPHFRSASSSHASGSARMCCVRCCCCGAIRWM